MLEPASRSDDRGENAAQDAVGIAQVAISALDGQRSHDWYATLGYAPAGCRRPTSDLSAVQGVPNARLANLLWLVDRQEFFQLEIFEYASPEVRRQRRHRRASDIGYARIGVWVADLDAALARLARIGTAAAAGPVGSTGARWAAVFDPDGVMVELVENGDRTPSRSEPARSSIAVATRRVTVSVPDLDRSLAFFADALGLRPTAGEDPHIEARESLWGMSSTRARRALLDGGQLWLELVQYLDPAGRPRPDGYRISDQGILNIAVASRSLAGFTRVRDAVVAAGYPVHKEIARDQLHIQYATDLDGFSVELGYFDKKLDDVQGFLPRTSTGELPDKD